MKKKKYVRNPFRYGSFVLDANLCNSYDEKKKSSSILILRIQFLFNDLWLIVARERGKKNPQPKRFLSVSIISKLIRNQSRTYLNLMENADAEKLHLIEFYDVN